MPSHLQIDAAAVRTAMHQCGIPQNEIWRISIRGGPGGSALRRALRGGPLRRDLAERLAQVLHVDLDAIAKESES